MDNITKPVPWDSKGLVDQIIQLDDELGFLVESIQDNGEKFKNISDYLFVELGLGESWPRIDGELY
jgi:hypothetical protein